MADEKSGTITTDYPSIPVAPTEIDMEPYTPTAPPTADPVLPSGPPPAYTSYPSGLGGDPEPKVPIPAPIPVPLDMHSRMPTDVKCPYCLEHVVTIVDLKVGTLSWLLFTAICISGCILAVFLLLCWIPFCVSIFKDAHHKCPKCEREIGVYPALGKRMGQ